MQIRNLSTLRIPKPLWRRLAASVGLAGVLPGAIKDRLGLYGSSRTLRVTVRPFSRVNEGEVTATGSYTFGHVTLYPCRRCNPASLTQVYLHELVHAWLHQYHEGLYEAWSSCEL